MRYSAPALLATAFLISAPTLAGAASLQVSPVMLDIPAPRATATIKLRNEGTAPLNERLVYPQFDVNINTAINDSLASFHAGSIRFEKRYSSGLYWLANYQYSKGIDDNSGESDNTTAFRWNRRGTPPGVPIPSPKRRAGRPCSSRCATQ